MSETDNGRSSNVGVVYDIESNSNVYNIGYDKINRSNVPKSASKSTKCNFVNSSSFQALKNLDLLYAKINRPNRISTFDLNNFGQFSQSIKNNESSTVFLNKFYILYNF